MQVEERKQRARLAYQRACLKYGDEYMRSAAHAVKAYELWNTNPSAFYRITQADDFGEALADWFKQKAKH